MDKQFKILLAGIILSMVIGLSAIFLPQPSKIVGLTDLQSTDIQSDFPTLYNANNAELVASIATKLSSSDAYATTTMPQITTLAGLTTVGTIGTGVWQGDAIADAYVADDITASNYLALTAWYATTSMPNLSITESQISDFGDYDVLGQATSTLASHTTTYNHANYDTAYGWGDHASAGYFDDIADFTGTLTNTKYCIYTTGTGIVCNSEGGGASFSSIADINSALSGETVASTTASLSVFTDDLGLNISNWDTAYGWGDWSGEGFLTAVSSDTTWTDHNSYPSACSAGQYVSAIGDTLTCSAPTNTTYTAGDALTLTGTDFDFDGGASPGGELGGTWANPTLDNDALDDQYYDSEGDLTTLLDDNYAPLDPLEKCFTLATSSFATYEDSIIWSPEADITVSKERCRVVGGTSVAMNISDGTNDMDSITCATTLTEDASLSNNTWSADEQMTVEFGTVTGNVTSVNYCILYTYD